MTTARISARRTDRATRAAGVRAAGRALALCSTLIPLLALSACGSGTQPQGARWTAWTRCGSLVRFDACPADGPLYGVALASPSEGWAVGGGTYGGTILHYTAG